MSLKLFWKPNWRFFLETRQTVRSSSVSGNSSDYVWIEWMDWLTTERPRPRPLPFPIIGITSSSDKIQIYFEYLCRLKTENWIQGLVFFTTKIYFLVMKMNSTLFSLEVSLHLVARGNFRSWFYSILNQYLGQTVNY